MKALISACEGATTGLLVGQRGFGLNRKMRKVPVFQWGGRLSRLGLWTWRRG